MRDERPYLLDVTRLIWRRWAGRLPTGIDRVCLAYLDHFGDRSRAVIQRRGYRRVLGRRASDRLFEMLREPDAVLKARLALLLARHAVGVPSERALAGKLYINVGHTGLDDPGLETWIRWHGVRPIYMVHDLIPITHPETCRPGEAAKHRKRMRTVVSTAAGVIGNSQATLDALETFRSERGGPAFPTIALHLGADAGGKKRRVCDDPQAPFVVLGTIEARKNHALLLEVWRRLKRERGGAAPRLTIIGQRGWECDNVFEALDSGEFDGMIEEVGRCSDDELASRLVDARALLFPSLVEGYGLPLVEALAAGTPVIASDIPVFREIGKDVPDFVSPTDPAAWADIILAFAEHGSGVRSAQMRRLDGFRAPGWAGHFERLDAWLDGL